MRGPLPGKESITITFSPFHSVFGFVMKGAVWICDYEELKVLQKMEVKGEKPVGLTIVNGVGALLIVTREGNVQVLEINQATSQFAPLASLKMTSSCPTSIQTVFRCAPTTPNSLRVDHCSLIAANKKSEIIRTNLTQLIGCLSFKKSRNFSPFSNPKRQLKENIDGQLKKSQYLLTVIEGQAENA